MRASKLTAPLSSVSVSVRMESIGSSCRTCSRPSSGAPPTRCVGESGVRSSGNSSSRAFSSPNSRSYSASLTSGSSFT